MLLPVVLTVVDEEVPVVVDDQVEPLYFLISREEGVAEPAKSPGSANVKVAS